MQRSGAGDAHAVAGFAEIMRHRRDEAELAAGLVHADITRRSAGVVVEIGQRVSAWRGARAAATAAHIDRSGPRRCRPSASPRSASDPMPLPCAHSISEGISSSFMSFSATALILTARPAARAASMPARTLSRSPQRVMARNFSGSSVSSETLMRRTPQSASSPAKRASCEPLVVSVSSSSAPEAEMARQRAHQRHHVAADQRFAAGQSQFLARPWR